MYGLGEQGIFDGPTVSIRGNEAIRGLFESRIVCLRLLIEIKYSSVLCNRSYKDDDVDLCEELKGISESDRMVSGLLW